MSEHTEPPLPCPGGGQLKQLEEALRAAQTHLALLKGRHAYNDMAIRNQERIIRQYERQIADLTGDWLNV